METSYAVGQTQLKESITRHELATDPKIKLIVDRLRQEASENPDSEIRLVLGVAPDAPREA
jgi:hypothetical protein